MSLNESFVEAVENGNLRKAKEYLSLGANITFNYNGTTALSIAIYNKDMRMVNFLLKSGKLPNSEIVSHIPYALYRHEKNISKRLVESANQVYQPSCSTESLVKLAIDNQWPDILKAMLERGLHTNKCADLDMPPLHYAAKQKDPIYTKIISQYTDVNDTKSEEVTPLMVAAEEGNIEAMEVLLKEGADPAAKQQPKVRINFLLPSIFRAAFIQMGLDYIDSVIHKAVLSHNPKTIDVLLKYKPNLDLNEYGTDGKTPLMIAAERNAAEMVHHLLKLGVDVNIRRGEGNALHSAVDGDSTKAIELLLTYGIDKNHKSNDYKTALDKAIYENRKYGYPSKKVIDLLIDAHETPPKIITQKPTYFPGREPKRGRGARE